MASQAGDAVVTARTAGPAQAAGPGEQATTAGATSTSAANALYNVTRYI
jgi:hypothetical protein